MVLIICRRLYCVVWKVKIVFLVFVALLSGFIALKFYIDRPAPPKYDTVEQSVTEAMSGYSDYKKGEREAIRHLAAQMRLYPKAKSYNINYSTTAWDGEDYKMNYSRESKQITRGTVCGCGGGYDKVSEKMIQDVAAKHGSIDDFAKMGCGSWP